MANDAVASRDIDAKGRTVRELLGNRKYSIDYYQREYKWERKQVAELIDDLSGKFLEAYEEGHDRSAVAEYPRYFLGSIIVSDKGGDKYIVDGQQRLTTLTLLLIYLQHQIDDADQKRQLSELIFSQKYGKRSFNLDIPERTEVMDALYKGEEPPELNGAESVANIVARYRDIEEVFPEDLKGDALPYFADWLIENVQLVEITAYSDSDAYAIFETMNDRGLSLAPADMLKGYLLSKISDEELRESASKTWRKRVEALQEIGKDEHADAIKAWLRSQYAESIRERKRNAKPQDFDRIGTEFHRWVRDREDQLGLDRSPAVVDFIRRDFVYYSTWYERLRRASASITPGFEAVYYNAEHDFTLQYPVLLAPLRTDDDEETAARKVRAVSAFLDILIYRRIWNSRSIIYSTMQYAMFVLMREIRGLGLEELAEALLKRLEEDEVTFSANDRFSLYSTKMNGPQVHRVLARITDYVEVQAGGHSRYPEYTRRGRGGYEIEHIWPDHYEWFEDEFAHPAEFTELRNRIGGLLLLPKTFNASYGDLRFEEKRQYYLSQNLLAQSLHEQAYERNPGFVRFVRESGLPFRPYQEFKREHLVERQALYLRLAERIWSPQRVVQEAGLA